MYKCNKDLLNVLKIEEFPNLDETKKGILPKYSNSNCTVITLGIGNDTLSEKAISKKLSQCTFLGVDPDAEFSGNLYKTDLKGIYVQGVIGANGNTKVGKNAYKINGSTNAAAVLKGKPHLYLSENVNPV
uniref:Uncharacterized protein n=1 Tax=Panagrolaimus davidi TaxID=227884 RepID=A0A914P9G5_9BILA